jgi:hypothetical protein
MKVNDRNGPAPLGRLALSAVAAALVLSVTAFGGAAQAGTERASTGTYPDKTGDSGSAPDISHVTVASTPDGQIVFRITALGGESTADVRTYLLIDTDSGPEAAVLAAASGLVARVTR